MKALSKRSLLYGYNDKERIVAAERVYVPGKPGTAMELFIQADDGSIRTANYPVTPCCYINDLHENMDLIDEHGLNPVYLDGAGYYNVRLEAESGTDIKEFAQRFEHSSDVFVIGNQALGMLQHGMTFYKGMTFQDVTSCFLDIEVYNDDPTANFVNSKKASNKIIVITAVYRDVDGVYSRLYCLEHPDVELKSKADKFIVAKNEEDLLKKFIRDFEAEDATFVFGHNICDFDMPYIADRCKMHNIKFKLGRNGSEPYVRQASMKLAERTINYNHWHIYGRHLIDTMHLAQKADIVKREFPDYTLKGLVEHLDMMDEDRIVIPGDEISAYWVKRPNELLSYALDDSLDTMKLADMFGQAFFYLSQMVPYGFQDSSRLGSGTLVQSIFLREYMRQGCAFPKPEPKQKIPGGFAGVFVFGHIGKPCCYLDVASLYPTLAEDLLIKPERDELEIYQEILRVLKATRLEIKAESEKANDPNTKNTLKSIDGSVKIVLNSQSYGILASETFLWNDYSEASRITRNGQKVIKTMMAAAQDLGGIPVKVDTDGMLVAMPDSVKSEADEKAFALKVQEFVNAKIEKGLFND